MKTDKIIVPALVIGLLLAVINGATQRNRLKQCQLDREIQLGGGSILNSRRGGTI